MTVGVLNLMGRTFMPPVDDPFRCADALVADLHVQTPSSIVDMHAEATSEKVAIGRHLDGHVSCVLRDAHARANRRRANSSWRHGLISDFGMTGPIDGIIGMESKAVLDRFLTGFSDRFTVQSSGEKQFCAAVVQIDPTSGKAGDIKRIFLRGIA